MRPYSSGCIRGTLLPPTARGGDGRLAQANHPPGNPGRFIREASRNRHHGHPLEQDPPQRQPHLPQVPRRRPPLAGSGIADLRGGPLPQVPDLRAPHPAVPGKLPVRGGRAGLAANRAGAGEAAGGDELAGVRLPPRHRRQPLPRADGPGLSGALRGRLQPQRGRGLRRHQLRGAVHRGYRHRGELRVRAARARDRQAHRRRRRRSGRTRRRVPAPPARASVHGLRRPRGARRHDALRHPRLPHAAATPRPRDRPHPRPRRHRGAALDAGRARRGHRGGRGGARRGAVGRSAARAGVPFPSPAATRRTA